MKLSGPLALLLLILIIDVGLSVVAVKNSLYQRKYPLSYPSFIRRPPRQLNNPSSVSASSCKPPLKCTVPITFKRTTALNNTRPRVIKMKPINSIRHKYKPQLTSTKKPPESREELYKYKPKFAIRNILHRSRHGRLNKLLSNISI